MNSKTLEVDARLNNLRDGSEAIDTMGGAPVSTPASGGFAKDGKESKQVAPAPEPEHRFGFWTAGTGTFADAEADKDVTDARFTNWGLIFGLDYMVTDNFVLGVLGNYTHTWADLDTQGSDATVDTYGGGLYAGYHKCGWYANGLFLYDHNDYHTHRNVILSDPLFERENGKTSGDQYGVSGDIGYDWHPGAPPPCAAPPPTPYSKDGKDGGKNVKNVAGVPPPPPSEWTIGPFVGLEYLRLNVDGFTERAHRFEEICPGLQQSDIANANLVLGEQDMDSLRSRVGVRVNYHREIAYAWAFATELRAAWQHEYLDDEGTISARFQALGLGGTPFAVKTSELGRDAALVGAGINFTFRNAYTFFTDYEAQVGQSEYMEHNVKGGVRIKF
jgi:outer membrane autotransporter protein